MRSFIFIVLSIFVSSAFAFEVNKFECSAKVKTSLGYILPEVQLTTDSNNSSKRLAEVIVDGMPFLLTAEIKPYKATYDGVNFFDSAFIEYYIPQSGLGAFGLHKFVDQNGYAKMTEQVCRLENLSFEDCTNEAAQFTCEVIVKY